MAHSNNKSDSDIQHLVTKALIQSRELVDLMQKMTAEHMADIRNQITALGARIDQIEAQAKDPHSTWRGHC